MVGKPVIPKCGLRVECVGNRHDNSYHYYLVTPITTAGVLVMVMVGLFRQDIQQ